MELRGSVPVLIFGVGQVVGFHGLEDPWTGLGEWMHEENQQMGPGPEWGVLREQK